LDWSWLECKHESARSLDYYTYEQDLALCQVVVAQHKVGQTLGQNWFRDHVVGLIPVLDGRKPSGLYGRFSKRLSRKLSKALLFSKGEISYKWLREMHGLDSPEDSEQIEARIRAARKASSVSSLQFFGEESEEAEEGFDEEPLSDLKLLINMDQYESFRLSISKSITLSQQFSPGVFVKAFRMNPVEAGKI